MVDEDNQDVAPGAEGELWLQGPVIFRGYHNNPVADRDSFENGWYKTGDVGVFKNGLFYIVDRRKELIKYKGMQVAPAELEALLISHDDILDAAVIGVEAEGTEVPRAYVVADPKKISEQQIKDFVKKNMAGYKQLRGGVVFMAEIPKSPSGKILRKDLRVIAKAEAAAPKAKL
jgi:acyl-CoA synthetase (AMP-forming)/AMP-acid ligase II